MLSPELLALIFLTLWGACVGSFLNVVIYRVPEGLSVVHPPSRCPGCENKLALYDNVPVLGWLWLRGKCRNCKMKISPQYPLIEAFTALCFLGLTAAYYFTALRPAFASMGIAGSWPVLAVHLVLLSAMIAATVIDAKLFIIPLGITWVAALVAVVVMPLAVGVGWVPVSVSFQGTQWEELVPWVSPEWLGVSLGGGLGLLVAVVLLHLGVLPQSFSDEPELPEGADPNDPEHFFLHPHPKREVGKELIFLALPVLGALVGYVVGPMVVSTEAPFETWDARATGFEELARLAEAASTGALENTSKMTFLMGDLANVSNVPSWLLAFGGVLLGFLVGAAVVWFTRILGTLMFGKEAMGLGDVHLMAAVGAVIGWRDVTLAFFVAPFLGLLGTALIAGLGAFKKGGMRPVPYGPYLCAATVIVMLLRGPFYRVLFPDLGG